jgi:hypothetical protein
MFPISTIPGHFQTTFSGVTTTFIPFLPVLTPILPVFLGFLFYNNLTINNLHAKASIFIPVFERFYFFKLIPRPDNNELLTIDHSLHQYTKFPVEFPMHEYEKRS